jgi:hypothetical protein
MPGASNKKLSELVTRYQALSRPRRVGLWALIAIELALAIAAQRDIGRRPAEGIRGPKLLWRAVATLNIVGPLAYFRFGRRRSS